MLQSPRRRILVTDADQRASLAIVRSFGRAGHVVFTCSGSAGSIAGASRYVSEEYVIAHALSDPDAYVSDIAAIVSAQKIDVLIPVTEASLLALLPARDRFDGVLIPFADTETFRHISDKAAVLNAALGVGIAIPAQHTIQSADDARTFDVAGVCFPVVVKPARSVAGAAGERLKLSVQHAASEHELLHILGVTDPRAYPLLIQQRIVGPGVGVFLLMWNGECVASFSHRRIREKPPSGGVSVYRESLAMDDVLLGRSIALLRDFDWDGVAMIEYKVDEKTGVPYLMEINGRFWGSLQLAVDAGVDFPVLLVDAADGQSPEHVMTYETGVRLKWLWGEVDHLIARMRSSNEKLALPAGAPSRSAAVRDFFRHHPGDRSEVLRWDDPKPFVRESIEWFRQLSGH